ncbi:MAG: ABC transporter ATP-binding protein [Polyangiales bacterium]
MLQVHQLTRRFGAVTAVEDLSFALHAGQMLALIGANGAGKSTVLRLLAGSLMPCAGQLRLKDATLATGRAWRAQVGYLPARPPLYPELRVCEQLDFGAALRAIPATQRPTVIAAALAAVGATQARRSRIRALSTGWRQRVALAQALLGDPCLLLLDEPTASLDPGQRAALLRCLRDRCAAGRAVVWTTHQLVCAQAHAHVFVLLDRGRVLAQGSLADLRQQADVGPEADLARLWAHFQAEALRC